MKKNKLIIGIVLLLLIAGSIGGILLYNSNRITYTKEFAYLPKYKNMEVNNFQPSKNAQYGNAVYKLEGVEYKEFLDKYEKLLKRDGWQVTQDKKPQSLEVKKGNHIARINTVNSKNFITILIWTK